ncbi:MAG: hypothetical protein NZ737_02415 [Candidatus Poseidoniaceae archaeon]|nr:hypothetical protein [Candidatus Poseidoniaceae archaeon]
MNDAQALLSELHQARLDRLKEICAEHGLSRSGSVEVLRARLIADLVLSHWDLSDEGQAKLLNADLGGILAVFGIKKSGSIRERKQRLWLHLNHDAKQLVPEKLDTASRDELHELCAKLDLPRSGAKQSLLLRVAGVLTSQGGSWGSIKKSLRRPRGTPKAIEIPFPSDEEDEVSPTNEVIEETETIIAEEVVIEPDSNEVEIIEHTPVEFVDEAPTELTEALMEIENRVAEVDSLCRDFLVVGDVSDSDDVSSFVGSLVEHGLPVIDAPSRSFVRQRLMNLDRLAKEERDAMHAGPGTWREKEALRRFEDARAGLRESLPEIIVDNTGDMVKARMAFEEKARAAGLDMRLPSISGRLHALFDLQIALDEEIAATDPRTARRTRVIRILQHGAIHLPPSARRTLDRLERNIGGFEQLVEAILEKSEGSYQESQQALVIRFLEKKGYEVNNAELRPRVVAAAGVVGAELGHISPADVPRIAPGIHVSDTEVDSIIADLKRLANHFKPDQEEVIEVDEDIELAESVADAADRVAAARSSIDDVDDLLARLRISR